MKKVIFCVLVYMLMIVSTIITVTATTVSEKTSQSSTMRNTLYVGGSGPNNYTKIQDAINDANIGYTIFVYRGTYYENLIVNKSITLQGENKEITIINESPSPVKDSLMSLEIYQANEGSHCVC